MASPVLPVLTIPCTGVTVLEDLFTENTTEELITPSDWKNLIGNFFLEIPFANYLFQFIWSEFFQDLN